MISSAFFQECLSTKKIWRCEPILQMGDCLKMEVVGGLTKYEVSEGRVGNRDDATFETIHNIYVYVCKLCIENKKNKANCQLKIELVSI